MDNKLLKILLAITIPFILFVIYFKLNSYNIPIGLAFTYYVFCFIAVRYHMSKNRNKIIKLIENKYPELSNKLSSNLLGYNLGISSFRFSILVQFGKKTGYKEVDEEIQKYKMMTVKMIFIVFSSLIITTIAIVA